MHLSSPQNSSCLFLNGSICKHDELCSSIGKVPEKRADAIRLMEQKMENLLQEARTHCARLL